MVYPKEGYSDPGKMQGREVSSGGVGDERGKSQIVFPSGNSRNNS